MPARAMAERRGLSKISVRAAVALAIVPLVALVLLLLVLGPGRGGKGTITGTVTDALSGDVVYRARIVVGDRSTIRYWDKNFRITSLPPGTYTMQVSAPWYEPVERQVTIGRGTTQVDIRLEGKQIPGLHRIVCFAEPLKDRGIQIEIRFVNREGEGIDHFPRLPMTMEARVYAGGETGEKGTRGKVLYAGPVDLFWDSAAHLGKNKGLIPQERLSVDLGAEGRYGRIDLVLHTAQGDFRNTISRVPLEW